MSQKVFKQQLRDFLLESVAEKELEQWYDPLSLERVGEKSIRILFPHQLFREWFNFNFRKMFEEKISKFNKLSSLPGYGIQFDEQKVFSQKHAAEAFVLLQCGEAGSNCVPVKCPGQAAPGTKPAPDSAPSLAEESGKNSFFHAEIFKPNLPERFDQAAESNGCKYFSNNYSFETFIFNKKNQFPVAAAQSFAKLESPSPLTFHAHTGCGKTHLLHSMYKDLKNFVPENNIFFGKLSDLETIINNNSRPGNNFYLPAFGARVFIIDNFQDCSGKETLQKNFIALIEFCQEQNIHLALSIDLYPDHWGFMCAKLRSMLASGLVIEIKKPDLEVKIQYIQTQNNLLDLKLKKSEILSLARQYDEFRQIQGILLKISAFKNHTHSYPEISMEKLIQNSKTSVFNELIPDFIIKKVAEQLGITPEDIKGRRRTKNIVLARHLSVYLLRDILMLNLKLIGEIMNRDHSSVLYSINKIKYLLPKNKEMNKIVANIKKLCLSPGRHSGTDA
jgi:chromosomal replication initiator protein